MNIITCIKQVPASSNVQVDPKTGVLIRDGNNVKMNPFDLFGLEASFMLKAKQEGSTVHVITIGIKNIMRAKHIVLIASGEEKKEAVYQMIYGDVTPQLPASILQLHPHCTIILDEAAASLLP